MQENCGFSHINWRNPKWKTSFFWSVPILFCHTGSGSKKGNVCLDKIVRVVSWQMYAQSCWEKQRNWFHAIGLFLFLQRTSENLWMRWYRKVFKVNSRDARATSGGVFLLSVLLILNSFNGTFKILINILLTPLRWDKFNYLFNECSQVKYFRILDYANIFPKMLFQNLSC